MIGQVESSIDPQFNNPSAPRQGAK